MSRLLQISNHLKLVNSSRYSFGLANHNNQHGSSIDSMPRLLSAPERQRPVPSPSPCDCQEAKEYAELKNLSFACDLRCYCLLNKCLLNKCRQLEWAWQDLVSSASLRSWPIMGPSKLYPAASESRGISTSSQVLGNSVRLQENLCYIPSSSGRNGLKKASQSNVYSDLINVLDTHKNKLSKQHIKKFNRRTQSQRFSVEHTEEDNSDHIVSKTYPRKRTHRNYDAMNYGTVATSNHKTFDGVSDPSSTPGWRDDVDFFNERFENEIFQPEFLEVDKQMVENEMKSFSNNLYENTSQSHETTSPFHKTQSQHLGQVQDYSVKQELSELEATIFSQHVNAFNFKMDPESVIVRPKTEFNSELENDTELENIPKYEFDNSSVNVTSSEISENVNISKIDSDLIVENSSSEPLVESKSELIQEESALEQHLGDLQMTESKELVLISQDIVNSVDIMREFPLHNAHYHIEWSEFVAKAEKGIFFEPSESIIEEEDILFEFPRGSDQGFISGLKEFQRLFELPGDKLMYNLSSKKTDKAFHYSSSFRDSIRAIPRLSGARTKSGKSGKSAVRNKSVVTAWMAFDKKQNVYDIERRQLADVACGAGMVHQITDEIKNTRENPMRVFQNVFKVTFPATYNILISYNAKKKDLETVKSLYDIMKEEKIQINNQTMAGYLECLGRMKNTTDNLEHIRLIMDEMKSLNLDKDELFEKCVFKQDERHYILQAINRVEPEFTPSLLPPPLPYRVKLLEKLNYPAEKPIDTNPYTGVMSTEDLKKNYLRQVETELQNKIPIPAIDAKPYTPKQEEIRQKIEMVEKEWKETIQKSFRKLILKNNILNFDNKASELYPFLTILPEETYVDLILQEMTYLATCPDEYSPLLRYLSMELGQKVYQKYFIQEKKSSGVLDKISTLFEKYLDEYNNPNKKYTTQRETWHSILNQHPEGPTVDSKPDEWRDVFPCKIGGALYDIILNDLKIDANLLLSGKGKKMMPAVYTIYRSSERTQFLEIKMNLAVSKLYQGCPVNNIPMNTKDLPMLSPPIPWLNQYHGGTVLSDVKLIRTGDIYRQQDKIVDELPPGQMNPALDSLNALAACAWKINQPILDIAIEIFNDKGSPKLEIPQPLSELPTLTPAKEFGNMTLKERSDHHFEQKRIAQLRAENWSLRSFESYRLSVANKYRNDIIWFPHNMDFRGRTYPTSPYLNHLGADISRGLLVFAKGRPLGSDGLNWLKIHLVNLTGLKKRSSNADRLAYAETLMDEVQDSADYPLTGRLWWQDCEEPWQVLACCMELTKAIRSPDHTKFISHFPVHQDGSCNGLQHYAALGRDETGAKSVNLCSFPEPQDVYTEVVELVEKIRKDDAEKGIEIAKKLEGTVLRKTIKQTVMTTVYGVTRYGATQQISKQLDDITDFDPKTKLEASSYLADKTFQSLKEMFTSTRNIQEWLRCIAEEIGRKTNKPIEWVTPLGLPIVQPYRSKSVYYFHMEQSNVDVNKQKNGFPPNFIHSLDSTHMMLTSLYCQWKGINFISVHDCFWTHASLVPIMNQVTREQFVNLHKQPILDNLVQDLSDSVDRNHRNDEQLDPVVVEGIKTQIKRIPARGDFDIERVLDSEYFFS